MDSAVSQQYKNSSRIRGSCSLGWVHYLAFDLFVGSWQVRDAQERGIPHLAVVPSLILTFLFGPVGLLLYFIIRLAKTRTLKLDSASRLD